MHYDLRFVRINKAALRINSETTVWLMNNFFIYFDRFFLRFSLKVQYIFLCNLSRPTHAC